MKTDIFGVHHKDGCTPRVTSRPASIAGRTLHTCQCCGARSITFDVAPPRDDA